MVTTERIGPCEVRVWSEGDGDWPPLLFLHGFEQHPGDAEFLRRLARNRRVVAPEHPGYGASTGADHLQEMLDIVVWYRTLIASLGDGPVDLVGHSLGGMMAAEVAAACPDVVRKLVLVGAYGLWLDDVAAADPFYMSHSELKAAKWHDPSVVPRTEPGLDDVEDVPPMEQALARASNLATATKRLWPIPDRGLRRRLPYIEAPTLVVHGESDGLLPLAYAEEFARLVPDATLSVVPRAGHLPMLERPDEFVALVEGFFDA